MWSPGGAPGPAGWDRRRVGARLRAALAGLQELQGLRARQQALVRGALAAQAPPAPAARRAPRAQELRLEAALAALQDQLNRLRRQDMGLKTQLDRLDQQISQLQLGVRRSSAEGPDSDSRPSSGFYELSDGGSCSPAASCTSVCSDRPPSALGPLLPVAPAARTSAGACRPWSADETTVCGGPPPRRAAEGRAGPLLQGTARPRPVSTGDLDRVLPAEAGLPQADADAGPTSLLCHGLGLLPRVLEPKYQCDLVSRGGGEVYPFPSPLHAVALQSPLFAPTKETPPGDSHSPPPSKPPPGPSGPGSVRTGPVPEAGSAQAYIDKLLGLWGRRDPLRGRACEQGPPGGEASLSQRAESAGCPERLTCSPRRADAGEGAPKRGMGGSSPEQRGPAPLVGAPHPRRLSEERHQRSGSCVPVGDALGPPQPGGGSPSSCPWARQAAPEDWRGEARPPTEAPRPCAHPHSVASGAALMGLKMGHPRTKAVRMGRGACDRALGSGRQPPPWGAPPAPQRPPTWGAWLRGGSPQATEAPGRSCSETSLYPVSFFVPLLVASREGHGASSAQALFPLEVAPPVTAGGEARRRQRRWRSSVEIAAGARGPGPRPPRPAARRGAGPPPVCSRARPRPPRRDAQAGSPSGGSEPSAEGSAPFRSTIAETSGDEASDRTADRCGDRESSGSDAGDRVQGAGDRAQPPRAPACSRPPLPPAPRLCRVKASRVLKKKIRRFQPAALKVMTLV